MDGTGRKEDEGHSDCLAVGEGVRDLGGLVIGIFEEVGDGLVFGLVWFGVWYEGGREEKDLGGIIFEGVGYDIVFYGGGRVVDAEEAVAFREGE